MFIASYLPVGAEDIEKFILRNQHEVSFRLGRGAASTFFTITTHIPQKPFFFVSDMHCRMLTKLAPFSGLKNPYTPQSVLRELSVSQV